MKIVKGLACFVVFTAFSVSAWAAAGDYCGQAGTYTDSTASSVYTGQNADDVINYVNGADATTLDACTGIDATEAAALAAHGFTNISGGTKGILEASGISTSSTDNDLDRLKVCAPATSSCTAPPSQETACSDTIDNDSDGNADCADSDCNCSGSITVYDGDPTCTGGCDTSGGMIPLLVSKIGAATTSIDCQVYEFNHPQLKAALINADQGGVPVRFATDDDHSDPASLYYTSLMELVSGGVELKWVNSSGIMHTKYCIFDGEDVFSGSMNFTEKGAGEQFNYGTAIDGSPDTVDAFQCNFNESWNYCGNGTNGSCAPAERTANCANNSINVGGKPLEICFSPNGSCMSRLRGTATHTSGFSGTCASNPCASGEVCFDYKFNNNGVVESRHACDACNATGSVIGNATTRQAVSAFFFTDSCMASSMVNSSAPINYCLWDALGALNAYSQDNYLCSQGVDCFIEDLDGKNHSKVLVADNSVVIGSMNFSMNGDVNNDEQTIIIHDSTIATQVFNDLASDIADLDVRIAPCVQQSTENCTDGYDNTGSPPGVDYCDASCGCTLASADCLSCLDVPGAGGGEPIPVGGGDVDCDSVVGDFCGLGGTYTDSTGSSTYTGQNADDVIKFVNNSSATTLDACAGIDATEATNLAEGSFSSIDAILATSAISTSTSDNDLDYLKSCATATSSCTTSTAPECSGTGTGAPAGFSCTTTCVDSRDGSCYCQSTSSSDACYDASCDPGRSALTCTDLGGGQYKCATTGSIPTGDLRAASVTFARVKGGTSEVHTNTKWYALDEAGLVYESMWCESPHPYANSCGYGVSGCANNEMYYCGAYRANAQKIAVWFAAVDTESCQCNGSVCSSNGSYECLFDYIDLKNSSNTHVAYYGGPYVANSYKYGWSTWVTGTSANLYLDSDSTVNDWGFAVSAVVYQPPSSSGGTASTGGGGLVAGASCDPQAPNCATGLSCQYSNKLKDYICK